MKNAIIIHGMPSREEFESSTVSPANSHWIPWIKNNLIKNGINAISLDMPEPYAPVYEKWEQELESCSINEETVLIGHSCGAGFLVRWFSENNIKVGKVFLVAPWLDPEKYLKTGMFDFNLDKNLADKTNGVTVIYSTDDDDYILDTIQILKTQTSGINFYRTQRQRSFLY